MLSDLDMMNLWAKQLTGYASQWERLFGFGYAVEAEVRKQDDALIRQMLEALEQSQPFTEACANGKRMQWWGAQLDRAQDAITAGRARLGGKP